MNNKIVELPSGRMIKTDNIIYISDYKGRDFIEGICFYFDIIFAGGEKIKMKYVNIDSCERDWNCLRSAIKTQ